MKNQVSAQTRNNWLVDISLFISALIVVITSIYFLFLPVGGYQGGRNPLYGIEIMFSRSTWGDLHTWSSVAMILIAVIHIPLHWSWIVSMTKRMVKGLFNSSSNLNNRGRFNVAINVIIGLSFLIAAVSGLYFFLEPGVSFYGSATNSIFILSRSTWDVLHTWSGVTMIMAASLHFAIHWKWVTKVTTKMLKMATWSKPTQNLDETKSFSGSNS
jgi:hypothetical protein